MPTVTPYSATKFEVWSEFSFKQDDQSVQVVEFNIVQFTSSFEINGIPSASILITIGRRADDPCNKIAQIHNYVNDLKLIIPVVVKMKAISCDGNPGPETWPTDEFRIFEGYATGSGVRKTSHGIEYTVFLTHWLSDLSFSSAISRTTLPISPGQLSFASAFMEQSSGGAGDKHMTASTLALKYMSSAVVKDDFWGAAQEVIPASPNVDLVFEYLSEGVDIDSAFNLSLEEETVISGGGLKRWFVELAQRDQIDLITNSSFNFGTLNRPNYEALRALSRFEPNANGESGYKLGVPLRMLFDSDDQAEIVALSIANSIAGISLESVSSTTIWDKIIQIGAEYIFSVIPMVGRALTVPWTPGLRNVWRTIWATQYERIESTASMPRPLRGVVMYRGRAHAQAGGDLNVGNLPPKDAAAGVFYEARPGDGLVIFKEAPAWLSDVVPRSTYPPPSKIPFGTATDPAPGIDSGEIDEYEDRTPAEMMTIMNPLLRRYAQASFMQEILRGRQGYVSGKLRFDIAPGSCIRIQGSEEQGIRGRGTGFEEFMYATVIGVTTSINSETGAAGTSLHIMFIRNPDENSNDATSTSANTLWANPDSLWFGGPLVDAYPFTVDDSVYTEDNTIG